MIAECIERMSRRSCGSCARRESCAVRWPEVPGLARSTGRRPATERGTVDRRGRNPFFLLLREVAKAIESSTAPRRTAFRREVERRLEPLLASGPVPMAEVARDLGWSRQTLYRRLKTEGTTFAEVLDGLRRRLAVRMVREEGLSVKETAWRLGFSDPAAFSRAYKRWTGASPRGPRGSKSA